MLRNTLLFSVSIVAVLVTSMPAAGDFVETFKVDAADATSGAQYGAVTGVSGNIGIVGSHAFSSGQGKAYLFDVTTGLQLAELPNPDHTGQDFFGYSVAIDGNTAVVGAARKPGNWTTAIRPWSGQPANQATGPAPPIFSTLPTPRLLR